jgi:peptide/nickel transport system substrate-binding protein
MGGETEVRRRLVSVVSGLLAALLLMTACGPTSSVKQEQQTPQNQNQNQNQSKDPKANQLVVLIPGENSTLDPAVNYGIGAQAVLPAIYETLVKYTADGKVEPQLATSWQRSDDGKAYTFQLRKGVKFHDGEPFNAQALKTSLERFMAIGQAASYIYKDSVERIDTPDEYTVVFHLKQPLGYFLLAIASPWAGGVVSPKAFREHETVGNLGADWFKDHAVGTGPYKLKEYVAKDYSILERNPDWWGWAEVKNPSPFDKIMVKTVTESSTERLMLEQGEADMAFGIKVQDAPALQKKSDLTVLPVSTTTARILAFNNAKKPTNDVRVRQALSYAFPYDDAVASYGTGAKRMTGQLPAGMIGYDATLPVYTTDLEKAKKLLADAGYGNGGLKLNYVWVTGEEDGRKVAELWQSNLKKLGVDLNIQEVAINAFSDMLNDPEKMPEIAAHMWGPDYPDFTGIVSILYDGRQQKPNGNNMSFYQNKQVDALLDQINIEGDQAKRVEAMKQVQTLLLQDAPSLWVAFNPVMVAYRKNVQGHVQHPLFEYKVEFAQVHK